jgi:sugar/nucleoside kinase (ribokinase family)
MAMSAMADETVSRLRAEGVRVTNLRTAGEPHAISVALSTPTDRSFVTFQGVNDALEARLLSALGARLPRTRHLHLALGPRDLPAWTRVVHRCRERGITTSWDFGWHESLPRRRGFRALLAALDWVFVNEREAVHYAAARPLGQACVRWRSLARRTIIKLGARGAAAVLEEGVRRVSAPRVDVVDTTGAGDAFNGGFLAALLAGKSAEACLRAGVRIGSWSVRAAGGLDGLPSHAQLARKPGRSRR